MIQNLSVACVSLSLIELQPGPHRIFKANLDISYECSQLINDQPIRPEKQIKVPVIGTNSEILIRLPTTQ